MYLTIPELKFLTIEHTNKCTLKCPQCLRTAPDGGLNPNLTLTEWSLDDYKRIAPPEFYRNIPTITFTGCYGDALASSNFPEIVEYMVSIGSTFSTQTNGFLRDNAYYEHLAEVMKGNENRGLEFAIDGLEDTYNIYRKNSNFNIVMEHVKAFINAGGNARWNVILFDHIAHQKQDIIQRAKDMGFKSMNIKKVVRSSPMNRNYYKNLYERKYFEEDEFGNLLDEYRTYENYTNHCKINCLFKDMGQLYIDHQMSLWPCTIIAGVPFYQMDNDHLLKKQILDLFKKYGEGFNSLKTKTIDEVLNHPWFQSELESSWCSNLDEGKLLTCTKSCGDHLKVSNCAAENREKIFF